MLIDDCERRDELALQKVSEVEDCCQQPLIGMIGPWVACLYRCYLMRPLGSESTCTLVHIRPNSSAQTPARRTGLPVMLPWPLDEVAACTAQNFSSSMKQPSIGIL